MWQRGMLGLQMFDIKGDARQRSVPLDGRVGHNDPNCESQVRTTKISERRTHLNHPNEYLLKHTAQKMPAIQLAPRIGNKPTQVCAKI
jgi:hypothetical protein